MYTPGLSLPLPQDSSVDSVSLSITSRKSCLPKHYIPISRSRNSPTPCTPPTATTNQAGPLTTSQPQRQRQGQTPPHATGQHSYPLQSPHHSQHGSALATRLGSHRPTTAIPTHHEAPTASKRLCIDRSNAPKAAAKAAAQPTRVVCMHSGVSCRTRQYKESTAPSTRNRHRDTLKTAATQ